MLVVWLIIIAVSFVWTIWCIYLFLKNYNKSKGIHEEFINYLETKNDFDTLYKIGEYNKDGYKERRRAPGSIAALQLKYNETNDIKYKKYAEDAINATTTIIGLGFGIFIGAGVFLTILSIFLYNYL